MTLSLPNIAFEQPIPDEYLNIANAVDTLYNINDLDKEKFETARNFLIQSGFFTDNDINLMMEEFTTNRYRLTFDIGAKIKFKIDFTNSQKFCILTFEDPIEQCIYEDDIRAFIQIFKDTEKIKRFYFLAAIFGSEKIFKYLNANGFEIPPDTVNLAFAGNNKEIIHICEQIQMPDHNALENAIKHHHNDSVFYLLSKYNLNPIWTHICANYNFSFIFAVLFNIDNIDIFDNDGETALVAAIVHEMMPLLKILTKLGSNMKPFPHAISRSLISIADSERKEIYEYVFNELGFNPKDLQLQSKILQNIIINDNRIILQYLLDIGFNVDEKIDIMNLLMACAKYNSIKCAELVIERGINIDSQNRYGWTALDFAAFEGNYEIFMWLIEHNAQIINEEIIEIASNDDIIAYLESRINSYESDS